MLLTVDVECNPLADSGWDAVGGNAQIGAHAVPADAGQGQDVPLHLLHCTHSDDNTRQGLTFHTLITMQCRVVHQCSSNNNSSVPQHILQCINAAVIITALYCKCEEM